ncbi:hypothetical protein MHYP_G00359930 [Metynnis hypsauchen]
MNKSQVASAESVKELKCADISSLHGRLNRGTVIIQRKDPRDTPTFADLDKKAIVVDPYRLIDRGGLFIFLAPECIRAENARGRGAITAAERERSPRLSDTLNALSTAPLKPSTLTLAHTLMQPL